MPATFICNKPNLLILCFLLVQSYRANSQSAYLTYPSYDAVINKFAAEYAFPDAGTGEEIKFEKRPAGWFVTLKTYTDDPKIIKTGLFWNPKTKKYAKIDFKKVKAKEENEAQLEKFQNDWSKQFYGFCPYYGYKGWDWDIIQEFKDAKDLPDSTMYALGRAYSSYANNLLNNNTGMADSLTQFKLPEGKNSMTKAQLETYRQYRHLAIESFKKAAALNPDYQTIVGAIAIKASNEYITSFLDLRMYQNEEEARKELVQGLYNPFYISAAKNYLISCPQHAILFTNGDNDTYPLLYVQAQYGFRTDVMVVNLSLLNTTRYINSLREKILDAPALPISFTPGEMSGDNFEYIQMKFANEDNTYEVDLRDFIKYIRDKEHAISNGDYSYYGLESRHLHLDQGAQSMTWEIQKNYYTRSELIVLDLLATNNWERPVCYAATVGSDNYLGLDDYLSVEGFAYQIQPVGEHNYSGQDGSVNSEVLYTNLVTKFDWDGIDKIAQPDEKRFCINYRLFFSRLAETLIDENKPDSARNVLDKCIQLFPNENLHYNYAMLTITESYYKLNEFEKANKIAITLARNVKNNLGFRDDDSETERSQMRDAILHRLETMAKLNDQQELLEQLKK